MKINEIWLSGGWATWSEWSSWGKGLCEGNQRVKTRACSNPIPSANSDDLYCIGDSYIKEVGESKVIFCIPTNLVKAIF